MSLKAQDLRGKSDGELREQLGKFREEYFLRRFSSDRRFTAR